MSVELNLDQKQTQTAQHIGAGIVGRFAKFFEDDPDLVEHARNKYPDHFDTGQARAVIQEAQSKNKVKGNKS